MESLSTPRKASGSTSRSSSPSSRSTSSDSLSTSPSSLTSADTGLSVRIIDVSPRDGLQNISTPIPTATKIELIHRLRAAGLKSIELTSAVSPKAVPQLADADALLADHSIQKLIAESKRASSKDDSAVDICESLEDAKLNLPVLVPNVRGFERARKHGVREVAVFVSASEEFSWANTRCSIEEGLRRAVEVAEKARAEGVRVRGYISCIFTSPSGTPTPPSIVHHLTSSLLSAGIYEISLGDTLGTGTPFTTRSLLTYLLSHPTVPIPASKLAGHFHDTYGTAITNVWTAYELGVRAFDASVAGLGGCPYAKGARGNVATEDVVWLFENAGVRTGVDLEEIVKTGEWISRELGRENESRAGMALAGKLRVNEERQKESDEEVLAADGSDIGVKARIEREVRLSTINQRSNKTWTPKIKPWRVGFKVKVLWGRSR